MRFFAATLTLFVLATGPAGADDPAALDAALRDGRATTGATAASAAVMRCGELVWAGADGTLDTESGRPATTDTRFVIASATKPVIAALVLGVVEREQLTLGTKLSRFYPRLPKARRITIRMLLGHTSGLSDYFATRGSTASSATRTAAGSAARSCERSRGACSSRAAGTRTRTRATSCSAACSRR